MDRLIRKVQPSDLDALVQLEQQAFPSDGLSRRAMKRWIGLNRRVFLVVCEAQLLIGYVLIIHHEGTRLGRVYSLAIATAHRGKGLAQLLLDEGEQQAARQGCIDMRLEVSTTNHRAIDLYHKRGYQEFGVYKKYYDNCDDALRMQKRLRQRLGPKFHMNLPWHQQQTAFTCGPACLLMALKYFDPKFDMNLSEELQLWREATTIHMTSGQGGCHPLGLAVAGLSRGLTPEVWLNCEDVLFLDGVRDPQKKLVMSQVDQDFRAQTENLGIQVEKRDFSSLDIEQAITSERVVLLLISTWRLDRRKAPHWVVVTGFDDHCFYVHDPDPSEDQRPLDLQDCPIAKSEIEQMSRFGKKRLQTAIIFSKTRHQ